MFEIVLDERDKLVRAKIVGVMSVAEARQFNVELSAIAKTARAHFGCFRLVADTVEAPVQPLEILALLPSPADILAGDLDRWAVVVGSSLSKMQASRILAHPQAKAFLSPSAAETWSSAYAVTIGDT